ncbi:hypothetical protein [Corallibacter sp.]|uniref:hypothetical protein n=1 Tax=Corallibacter sp. TaxID=2038084 RepID=UPI003AB3F665
MPKKRLDYPILFYIIRVINIFCVLAYLFFVLFEMPFGYLYLLVYFYFWLLIVLTIIEIGYVVKGDKQLFMMHRKSNLFFLTIYFLSIIVVLLPFLAKLFK